MISEKLGLALVQLVRQEIHRHLALPFSDPVPVEVLSAPILQEKRGVFVTLYKDQQLRGCIGSLSDAESILDGVKRHAINAAFHDNRFSPVCEDEVNQLHLEVSVLTQPTPLPYTQATELSDKLRPMVDGVIIKAPSGASATFLPQVWKQLPQVEQFLAHLCVKAGLKENSWQSGNLEILTYTVQYFKEPC